jgi:thiosulfate dehydrogenase
LVATYLWKESAVTKGFVVGFLAALVVLVIGGYFFVTTGALHAGQDVKPGGFEKWAAKSGLRATIRRETQGLKSPLEPTDENLTAGVALYDAHCRVCHGGSDGVASSIAKGLTPTAPQLAQHGVEDDPVATTYWKVAHGIRFTGMPGFRATLSDREIWQLALFAANMKALPPGAHTAWLRQKAEPRPQ